VDPQLVEFVGKPVAAQLGAGKHQHLPQVAALDQMREQLPLALMVHRVHHLGDIHRGFIARHLDEGRVVENAVGELADFFREGGREHHVHPLRRQQRNDALQVGHEAHVEHAVGLVEHQRVDLIQHQRLILHMVKQAAGGRHQDFDAGFQDGDLRVDADPAIHHQRAQRHMLGIGLHGLLDLDRELAREDQRTDRMLGRRGAGVGERQQALDQRQRECGGFPGAGLRRAKDVGALQRQRNHLLLDRCRRDVSHLVEGTQDVGGKPEFSKSRQCLSS